MRARTIGGAPAPPTHDPNCRCYDCELDRPPRRHGFALDCHAADAGPGAVFVLDTRRSSATFGERIAGPFGNEWAAFRWIEERSA